jgi:hypothetical protein
MKNSERNKMLKRYEDLTLREESLIALLATVDISAVMFTQISNILKETQSEILKIRSIKDQRIEFLFNFKGGGWNSEYAFTEEQAIEQAIEKYGLPTEHNKILNIDTTSFRASTHSDYQNLLSMFN